MGINRFQPGKTLFLLYFAFSLLSACGGGEEVNFYRKSPERERNSKKDRSAGNYQFVVLDESLKMDLPKPWSMGETLDFITCREPLPGTPRHLTELQNSTFIFRNKAMDITPVKTSDTKDNYGLIIDLYIKYGGRFFVALVYQIRHFDFRSSFAYVDYDFLTQIHGELLSRGETLIIPGIGKAVPSVDITEHSYWPTLRLTLDNAYLIGKAGHNVSLVSNGMNDYYFLGSDPVSINYCL